MRNKLYLIFFALIVFLFSASVTSRAQAASIMVINSSPIYLQSYLNFIFTGFQPGASVIVSFPGSIAYTTANSSGAGGGSLFVGEIPGTCSLSTPIQSPGSYTITASDSYNHNSSANFTVATNYCMTISNCKTGLTCQALNSCSSTCTNPNLPYMCLSKTGFGGADSYNGKSVVCCNQTSDPNYGPFYDTTYGSGGLAPVAPANCQGDPCSFKWFDYSCRFIGEPAVSCHNSQSGFYSGIDCAYQIMGNDSNAICKNTNSVLPLGPDYSSFCTNGGYFGLQFVLAPTPTPTPTPTPQSMPTLASQGDAL